MKKYVCALIVLGAGLGVFSVPAQQNSAGFGAVLNHYAANSQFTAGAVPRADLERIVQAGVRSPSANNRQPWHFTVVQDPNIAKRIVPQTLEGNVLIVVSTEGDGANGRQILDCALATQSIYLAAQALGYGSRIYTGPIEGLNRIKAEVGLPGGYSAVSLVRVGKVKAGVDAVSAASNRKETNSVVTYK